MSYFTSDYLDFFAELSENNDRDWFNAQKKRFEQSVKKPFLAFIADVIEEARKLDPSIAIEPKDALFRIHKDTRFSKDKTPYKLHMSAIISPNGRKDMEFPGYYIQLGAEQLWIGGGAYALDKQKLEDIRYSLIDRPGVLSQLISEKAFQRFYGELLGEKYKVLPKEWKERAEAEPLLFHKQFYYMHEIPAQNALKPGLLKEVSAHLSAAKPVSDYLVKAMYH